MDDFETLPHSNQSWQVVRQGAAQESSIVWQMLKLLGLKLTLGQVL